MRTRASQAMAKAMVAAIEGEREERLRALCARRNDVMGSGLGLLPSTGWEAHGSNREPVPEKEVPNAVAHQRQLNPDAKAYRCYDPLWLRPKNPAHTGGVPSRSQRSSIWGKSILLGEVEG